MTNWRDSKPKQSRDPMAPKWWAPGGDEAHRASDLMEHIRRLESTQAAVHTQNLINARVYSNRELAAFTWGHDTVYDPSLEPLNHHGENLALTVVETIHSRIGKHRTKLKPVPHDATYRVRRACVALDRWFAAEIAAANGYPAMTRAFRDSLIFHSGVVKLGVHPKTGRTTFRRVFPDDFMVDNSEAVRSPNGRPAHEYERRCLAVEDIEAEFALPEGTVKTDEGKEWAMGRTAGRGFAIVVEAYRCARNGHPGRHVVAVNDKLLVDEVWDEEVTPFVVYQYNEPLSGWYPPSVVEQVLPYQIRLDEINEVIRDAQDLMARPRILVHKGSQVTPADIDNLVGRIIQYTGIEPKALTWPAVSAELYSERDRVVRSCLEQFSLTQLMAMGRTPAGMRYDSSVALQEATAIADDRLSDPMTRWEDFTVNVGKVMLMLARRALKGKEHKVVWTGPGGQSRVVNFDDCALEDNDFMMSVEAASLASMSPAARRDTVEGWFAAGKIDLDQYWGLTESPDIESFMSRARADRAEADRVLDLLHDGKYESPHPDQNLELLTRLIRAESRLLRTYSDEVPAETLRAFTQWLAMADAITAKQQESMQPDPTTVGAPGMTNDPAAALGAGPGPLPL